MKIRAGYAKDSIYIYIYSLKLDIHDEISVLSPNTMVDSYQLASKAEEKLARKQASKGKSTTIGRWKKTNKGSSIAPRDGANGSSPK